MTQRTATAIIATLFCLMSAACAPIASGRWYDSEEGRQGKNFFARIAKERGIRAVNVPANGLVTAVKGDTYYKLSLRYKVPLRALLESNKARPPYSLSPGDRVKVPVKTFYKVRANDTLYAISRSYKTDIATLASMNGLEKPYGLRVGQKLQVPAKPRTAVAQQQPKTATPKTRAKLPQAPRRVGRFRVPVQGTVISGFGPKPGGLHNDGINIAAREGTPIKAAENGVVVYTGNELRGYGNLLLVRHGGSWVTAYAHASKFLVKRGDRVKQGQIIAEVGQTGNVNAPQLHFELRKGTRAVDPNSLI